MFGDTLTNTSPVLVDEAYKSAIQPVVDNSMRTDILGPHFCRVLKDHTPARTDIVLLLTQEINNAELKKALKSVIEEHNKETKMKWVDRGVGVLGTVLLAVVIWAIQHFLGGGKT